MSEKSKIIERLINNFDSRVSYVKAAINVNISSQIKALRLRQELTQKDLEQKTGMKQSRISTMERFGATSFTIDTIARLAAAFKVGLVVKFAPFSEMLEWENNYNQDMFNVPKIENDISFIEPKVKQEPTINALQTANMSFLCTEHHEMSSGRLGSIAYISKQDTRGTSSTPQEIGSFLKPDNTSVLASNIGGI